MNAGLLLRVTVPLVLTSLLLFSLGTGTAWYVHHLQKTVLEDLKANTSGVRAAEEIEILVREIRTQLDLFLRTGDRVHLKAIEPLRDDTERWLSAAERWSLSPEEKALTGRARAGYQHFVVDMDHLTQPMSAAERSQSVHALIESLVREVQGPIHEFLDINEDDVETSIAENQAFANRLMFGLLLTGVCGSGAGLAAGLGFARTFNRRLIQLSVPVRDAAGRLDPVVGPITFAASPNLRELENVLRTIAARIGAVVERLRESERQALQAEHLAAVGQMAAGMAHELRNPLTSMRILVQSAQDPTTAGRLAGRDLIVLEEEIGRLEQLVQSFVEFAQPPRAEKKTVDLGPLVRATTTLVAGRAAASNTSITFMEPTGPVFAIVDPRQVRQVLLNLLLNALDAVQAGPGDIVVRLATGLDGEILLTVRDNGPGIPESLGSRIFTPFVTTKEAGLGLGLSICKRIAEAHGGEMLATNRPEGGAEFTLRLPPPEPPASA
jgi:signal transduction histidine kinase